jgi:hypothetical protein
MAALDKAIINILEDGTVKVQFDGPVSPANHYSAEEFLALVEDLAGGETKRSKVDGSHQHQHRHVHEGTKVNG